MIKKENLIINGHSFVKTYSTNGFKIRKFGTDEIYDEAIDVVNAPYEYEETDMPIEELKEVDNGNT